MNKKMKKMSIMTATSILTMAALFSIGSTKVKAASSQDITGETFTFSGYDNDRTSKEGISNIVPSTITINGVTYTTNCIEKGSMLRLKNLYSSMGYMPGEVRRTHPDCDIDGDEAPDTSRTYFSDPVYTIEKKYDITGIDSKYQYIGYIFANVDTSSGGSWTAQRALWMSDINAEHGGKSITEPDTETEYGTDIELEEEIRTLSLEEISRVEEVALNVQLSTNVDEVISHLEGIISHYNSMATTASSEELRTFYSRLVNNDASTSNPTGTGDGLAGVLNWVRQNSQARFSDIKANVYQYLMTIDSASAQNVHLKIENEIQYLATQESLDADIGMSISTAGALKAEAYKYQSFYDDLQKNNGELKVEDLTSTATKDGYNLTLVDTKTNTYTIGPFKVKYNDAYIEKSAETGERINFAEITAIKLYNQNGQLYKTLSIDIVDENNVLIKGKNEFQITKSPTIYAADSGYIFPKSEEEFYIQFQGDGGESGTTIDPSRLTVDIEFRYIQSYSAEMYTTSTSTTQDEYKWVKKKSFHRYDEDDKCYSYTYTFKLLEKHNLQDLLLITDATPNIATTKISIQVRPHSYDEGGGGGGGGGHDDEYEIGMQISGTVWGDEGANKESLPDGYMQDTEKKLKNIEVTLYEYDETTNTSKIATLIQDPNGVEIRTNPTLTDENGYYEFKGVRVTNKYYVQFTYNGQTYQATTYTSQKDKEEAEWPKLSNASENQTTRLSYNQKLSTIESSPNGYTTSNSLGYGVTGEVFSQKVLMGYSLENEGNGKYTYKKTGEVVQLLDDTTDNTEGIISKKIQEYIATNKKYPNLKDDIYAKIIEEYSSDSQIKEKLQYIEDCKISSQTGINTTAETFTYDLYGKYQLINTSGKDYIISNGQYYLVDTLTNKDTKPKDFTESFSSELVNQGKVTYHKVYVDQQNVNCGLNQRTQADIAMQKDVEKAVVAINGKVQTYEYDKRSSQDEAWDIDVRLSDAYYDTTYSREIQPSDYQYSILDYDNAEKYGKDKEDELSIYVTYKLTIRNQSASIQASIDEIVDYYDKEYTYIQSKTLADGSVVKSYIELSNGNQIEINASTQSTYNTQEQSTDKINAMSANGYNTLYIKGLAGRYLEAGDKAYVYLTFEVNKQTDEEGNADRVILDEYLNGTAKIGKQNVAEINGYSTKYGNGTVVPNVGDVSGTPAGLVDIDSTPGNLNTDSVKDANNVDYLSFEDDTDKAPNISIKLYRDSDRIISGAIWEDTRNNNVGTTTIGNGTLDDGETKINGVTVQLVEIMDNGTEYVWREFGDNSGNKGDATIGNGAGSGMVDSETPIINVAGIVSNYSFTQDNKQGAYVFKSFAAGNYIVRYIYGDTVKTVVPGVANDKSYNGNDYKTTIYQTGIDNPNVANQISSASSLEARTNSLSSVYNIANADNLVDGNGNIIRVSDAKDIIQDNRDDLNSRTDVIDYSDNNVRNYIAEVLASFEQTPEYDIVLADGTTQTIKYTDSQMQALLQELMNNTKMTAETGSINIEIEYNTNTTTNQENNNGTSYIIQNVDLGLQERPKAQLAIEKEVENVKVTLANQSVLFDASGPMDNVLWQAHENYDTGYTANGLLDPDKFGSIENIRNNNYQKAGLVQMSVDEELMHGATIQITYKITVRNVGEVDYTDSQFYYTGVETNPAENIVTTTGNNVVDYVSNNLQYSDAVNSTYGWKLADKNTLIGKASDGSINSQISLVNPNLESVISEYNTIITNETLANNLVPEYYMEKATQEQTQGKASSAETTLVLTQLVTGENDNDDLTYKNVVEIVETSNLVGRRMSYSTVGNQNSTDSTPQEMDTDMSEEVRILPPFGAENTAVVVAGIAAIALTIIIGAVIFIKKKVQN